MSCKSCKYYSALPTPDAAAQSQDGAQKAGACRRNPPTVIGGVAPHPMTRQPAMMLQTAYPVVSENDQCGEFCANLEVAI